MTALTASTAWHTNASLDTYQLARLRRRTKRLAWHVVPRSISIGALMAAPLLDTWCFSRYRWLRLQKQHGLARGASLDTNGWQGVPRPSLGVSSYARDSSVTWHVVPRSIPMTALIRQHGLARVASLDISLCTYSSSNAWHVVPRWKPMAALTAAAWCGTGCLARNQLVRLRQHLCLAHNASLNINGCACSGSTA